MSKWIFVLLVINNDFFQQDISQSHAQSPRQCVLINFILSINSRSITPDIKFLKCPRCKLRVEPGSHAVVRWGGGGEGGYKPGIKKNTRRGNEGNMSQEVDVLLERWKAHSVVTPPLPQLPWVRTVGGSWEATGRGWGAVGGQQEGGRTVAGEGPNIYYAQHFCAGLAANSYPLLFHRQPFTNYSFTISPPNP